MGGLTWLLATSFYCLLSDVLTSGPSDPGELVSSWTRQGECTQGRFQTTRAASPPRATEDLTGRAGLLALPHCFFPQKPQERLRPILPCLLTNPGASRVAPAQPPSISSPFSRCPWLFPPPPPTIFHPSFLARTLSKWSD